MKFLVPVLCISLCGGLSAQNGADDFRAETRYFSDSGGSYLVVRPEAPTGSFAGSLELRIEDETFFNSQLSEFQKREIATIHGGGLSNFGLRFFTQELRSQEEFLQLLEEFKLKVAAFRRNRSEIEKLDEKWMGQGEASLSQSREITTIQTDFIDRPSVVTLNWDMQANRIWLSLDDFINIDSSLAEPLSRLIERIPMYSRKRQEYKNEIEAKNEWINQTLSLPKDAQDGLKADDIDTPTVISEEQEKKDEEKAQD